ncbi:hypothetical protein FPV67DRAFT_1677330 [Lyophyllum atratum]|nr:hypothetical protein FPV67DRAFT_1677330 [Lyophyllum atratum]
MAHDDSQSSEPICFSGSLVFPIYSTEYARDLAGYTDVSIGVKITLLLILAFTIFLHSRRKAREIRSSGPLGLPLVNVFQIPNDRQWLVGDNWKELYGAGCHYINIFGAAAIILSSYKTATELLDGRAAQSRIFNHEYGAESSSDGIKEPPSLQFKEIRRFFNGFIGPRQFVDNQVGSALKNAQAAENLWFLGKSLKAPGGVFEHARESVTLISASVRDCSGQGSLEVEPHSAVRSVSYGDAWNGLIIIAALGLHHLITEDDVSILHDPQTFPDPSAFKPERFLTSDGSFKTEGPAEIVTSAFDVCPGIYLAENDVFLIVATTLYFFLITKAIDEATGEE